MVVVENFDQPPKDRQYDLNIHLMNSCPLESAGAGSGHRGREGRGLLYMGPHPREK